MRELFLTRPSPILSGASEADRWRLALARMGVAVDALPFYPNQSEDSIARGRAWVRGMLERENPDEGG